jgi:hypothetical protein
MKRFFDLFKRHPEKAKNPAPAMQKLLSSVAMTEEREIPCDEVFALMDQFAELVRGGGDASQLMPLVDKHLAMCPDCREEVETLLEMMSVSSDDKSRRG